MVAPLPPDGSMTLPKPDPAFHWTVETWGDALRCRPLESIAQHAFTTRQLRLRLPVNGPDEGYDAAWRMAAASVGAEPGQVVRVKQVHGNRVRTLTRGEVPADAAAERPEADAIVSNAPGLVLSVQVADCVPILIADGRSGAAAAVHAGWRGTCAGIARAAVQRMALEFNADPQNLIAAVGPSIGPCCYEVGQSVAAAFRAGGANDEEIGRWFAATSSGALRLDLWAANRDQLVTAGVRDDRIHVCGLCTQTHRHLFESYRADGDRAGRMAALIRVGN